MVACKKPFEGWGSRISRLCSRLSAAPVRSSRKARFRRGTRACCCASHSKVRPARWRAMRLNFKVVELLTPLSPWEFKSGRRDKRRNGAPMDLNESFQQLEEKLARAGEVLKRAVAEKRDLQNTVEALKRDKGGSQERLESLQNEVRVLRREREEVRARIEKLLGQIEQLTGESTAD